MNNQDNLWIAKKNNSFVGDFSAEITEIISNERVWLNRYYELDLIVSGR